MLLVATATCLSYEGSCWLCSLYQIAWCLRSISMHDDWASHSAFSIFEVGII